MGTPHPSRNQGKILNSHGIERVNATKCKSVNCCLLLLLNHKQRDIQFSFGENCCPGTTG